MVGVDPSSHYWENKGPIGEISNKNNRFFIMSVSSRGIFIPFNCPNPAIRSDDNDPEGMEINLEEKKDR